MSNMYAIKDTTLTALGDAVRNKVFGTGDLIEHYNLDLNIINNSPYTNIASSISAKYSTHNKFIFDVSNVGNTYKTPSYMVVKKDNSSGPQLHYFKNTDGYDTHFEIQTDTDTLYIILYDGYLTLDITIIPLDENGNEIKYTPLEMADVINGLDIIPGSALNITGNCNYRFANGGYDWLINSYGEKMTTKDINSMGYMFAGSNIETIPFEINGYSGQVDVMNCFNASKIKQLPKMNIPKIGPLSNLFNNAYYLREIPDDKWNVGAYSGHTGAYDNHTGIFSSCYSLRYITPKLISNIWNTANGYYYSCYYGVFSNCYVLDEMVNLPVVSIGYTSNTFNNSFNHCSRLKDMIFETNEDGTAKIAGWKNQTLDLSQFVGYVYQKNNILNWNSGITADKEVKDDATYQELKDDPDWFSLDVNYSRYNRNSAIETINSLPDCSATGTNTIKFKGQAGALTDGGAINTLTEEEIAVASAKGWTVSLV